ncbi:MAG: hypothetical protein Q7T79_02930 [bacterium]|nr:hypothetical protein [bacterium]
MENKEVIEMGMFLFGFFITWGVFAFWIVCGMVAFAIKDYVGSFGFCLLAGPFGLVLTIVSKTISSVKRHIIMEEKIEDNIFCKEN